MPRLPRAALRALPFVLLSTACATPEPVAVRLVVPPSLLECAPQPEPPSPVRDDADLAYWIVDLAGAGADCRAKLAAVRGLVE